MHIATKKMAPNLNSINLCKADTPHDDYVMHIVHHPNVMLISHGDNLKFVEIFNVLVFTWHW